MAGYTHLVTKALARLGLPTRYSCAVAIGSPAAVIFSIRSVTGWNLDCKVVEADIDRLGALAATRQAIRKAISKTSAVEVARNGDPGMDDNVTEKRIMTSEAQEFLDRIKKQVGL